MSALIQSAVADIRAVLVVLHHLAKHDQITRVDLVNALDLLTDSTDEIEQVMGVLPPPLRLDGAAVVRIPLMTLADVVADAGRTPRRPALISIQGGKS